MFKKALVSTTLLILLATGLYITYDFLALDNKINPENSIISPIINAVEEKVDSSKNIEGSKYENSDIINILLLGIDRRSKEEYGYRTDIMILLTINKAKNKIVLTSIPRDLWYGGGRVNAFFIQSSWEETQNAFLEITGQKPDAYILTDFEDFSWIVDQIGGLPVTIETTFTDSQYPVDATKEYQTITFIQGQEKMSGDRALIFARSRKGDNDNGDWGRMKRQHLLLKSLGENMFNADSFICKIGNLKITDGSCFLNLNTETLKKGFELATTGRMETNLTLKDLVYAKDLYVDKNDYKVESLYMDYNYLYTPLAEDYGGAWVLAPIGDSFVNFHQELENKINNTEIQELDRASDEAQTLNN
ncbi:LCP family protein [Candidatus Nomurabacteria bacterium]|uniref:LCP family protein n=1 Tax=candidate division WWE3 bacterium TaxID=2053526 RepID=A0A955IWD1_UNCKA|nr:LCP family protein [candidate division WWE3 bacterium]MCB9824115.1 LCP family protein [Candidatus Nomurabacteria bacterium]MCB9826914.1 LCP family protein [Candidatus Nomurabacteria bacterium]MCB9828056.1 LCP family protein [Candidatus Nomurabacteria bacterium]HXK52711.1 LCP family protein [bacterium]